MITYAQLIDGKNFSLKVDPAAPTKNPDDYKIVGKPIGRLDIPGKLTGQFTYMQDFRVPGMLRMVAWFVRRRSALKLESVDRSSIKDIPGIVKVVRQENFLGVVAQSEWSAGSRRCGEIHAILVKVGDPARRKTSFGSMSERPRS